MLYTAEACSWRYGLAALVRRQPWGGTDINKTFRVNEQILRYHRDYPRVREARVIDEEGKQLGVLDIHKALEVAQQKGLDLIEVAPLATPPVCRIMDYGKYKYEQSKRDREAHKKQRGGDVKGVWFRPGTDDHDFTFKVRNALKFLGEGDKVKFTVRFRSREMSHPEFARKLLDRVVEMVGDAATVEKPPAFEGRAMTMIMAPRSQAAKVAAKKPAEKAANEKGRDEKPAAEKSA